MIASKALAALRLGGMGSFDPYNTADAYDFCGAHVNLSNYRYPEIEAFVREGNEVYDLEKREEMPKEPSLRYAEVIWAIPLFKYDRISDVADYL